MRIEQAEHRGYLRAIDEIKRYVAAGVSPRPTWEVFQEVVDSLEPIMDARKALVELLEWAVGNRGRKECNPYGIPEVKTALVALAKLNGARDWMDALEREKKAETPAK